MLAALALMCAVVGWLCWQRLMSVEPPPDWFAEIDLRNYFFPSLCYLRSQLAQGSLPLWNSHQLLGVPFAAALQPAVFYPLLTPLLVLRPEQALVLHGLLHLVLAGLFSWLYLRVLGASWWAAAIGGLAFLLSPGITQSLYNTAFLSSRIWLPALLGAIELIARGPSRGRCALLAGVVAMILLGGSAQSAVYMLQFGGVYSCFALTLHRRGGRSLRAAGFLLGGVLLGAALAAVQLGPTLELASNGVRSLGGMSEARAGASGVTPEELLALTRALGRQIEPLVVALAAAALLFGRLRLHAAFFTLALVVACDFQLGSTGSVFPVYFDLPLGNLFQVPERISFLSDFAVACLAGLGAGAVLQWLDARRAGLGAGAAAAMLIAVVGPRLVDELQPRAYSPLVAPAKLYGDLQVAALAATASRQERVMLRFRHEDQRVSPQMGSVHGFLMMFDYEPLLPAAYASFFSIRQDVPWRGRLTPARSPAERGRTDFAADFALLDSVAVRYYIEARGQEPARLFERRSALPRAYATTQLEYASSDEEALRFVTSDKFDPHTRVVVTSQPGLLRVSPAKAESEVGIASDRPGEVVLTTACEGPCLVVLSDLAYPGWHVSVDGRPAELIRANYLMRSVVVPGGSHTVRFFYSPRSFHLGLALSLGALVVVVLLVPRRRARPQDSES